MIIDQNLRRKLPVVTRILSGETVSFKKYVGKYCSFAMTRSTNAHTKLHFISWLSYKISNLYLKKCIVSWSAHTVLEYIVRCLNVRPYFGFFFCWRISVSKMPFARKWLFCWISKNSGLLKTYKETSKRLNRSLFINICHHNVAEILPIRHKTLNNRSLDSILEFSHMKTPPSMVKPYDI